MEGLNALSHTDQDKVFHAVKELDASLTRIESERELMKGIVEKVFEETQFPKKLLKKMGKAYFKCDFEVSVLENKEFESIYQAVVKDKINNG